MPYTGPAFQFPGYFGLDASGGEVREQPNIDRVFFGNRTFFDKGRALMIPLPKVSTKSCTAAGYGFQFGYFAVYYRISIDFALVVVLFLRQKIRRSPMTKSLRLFVKKLVGVLPCKTPKLSGVPDSTSPAPICQAPCIPPADGSGRPKSPAPYRPIPLPETGPRPAQGIFRHFAQTGFHETSRGCSGT